MMAIDVVGWVSHLGPCCHSDKDIKASVVVHHESKYAGLSVVGQYFQVVLGGKEFISVMW